MFGGAGVGKMFNFVAEDIWNIKMKKEIKYSKRIFAIWIGAVIMVMLFWGAILHDSVRQGRAEAKEVAIRTLCGVAEQVVSREFEGLGKCQIFLGDNGEKHTKRKAVSEAGVFEIEVDSLKEAQGLYSLDFVGIKAGLLNCYGKFPLEKIYMEWKSEMDSRYSGVMCALSLTVHPLGHDGLREFFVGDNAIVTSRYDLGTYYLDEMYTMRLTAYMMSGFWCCVDWTNTLWLVLSGLLLFIGLGGYLRFRKNEKEKIPNVLATTYRFGEYIFDFVNHTLTHRGKCVECKPQAAKLLLGFAKTSDLFLTNDEIAVICGWGVTDLNLDERRRKAISLLNKLFVGDDSVQIRSVPEKKGYQMIISK